MDAAASSEFAAALKVFLDNRPDMQVLWKLKRSGGLAMRPRRSGESDLDACDAKADGLKAIEKEIETGRVRIEEWLSVDPVAVLQSGHIACSVHHGGSNSFHEALR